MKSSARPGLTPRSITAHSMYPDVEQAIISLLPDPHHRVVALRQLVESADHAASVAPKAWGVTLARNLFRLNVGMVEALIVTADRIHMNCLGELGKAPFLGPHFQRPRYRSVRVPVCTFDGTIEQFETVAHILQPHHMRFIESVGLTKSGNPVAGSPHLKGHNEMVLRYAKEVVGNDVVAEPHMFTASAKINVGNKLPNENKKDAAQDPDRNAPLSAQETHLGYVALPDELGATLVEGAAQQAWVSRFERNPLARRRCIEHHGSTCVACGFSFGDVYGDLAEGYIHVHHLAPLAETAEEREVDPIRDLRPLCPNCHAVAHLKSPPLTPEAIAELLASRRSGG
ncbi:MAG: HNH endonuclease [Byssovorax sp.]